jgi:predicted nuclease of predicted toxin-antitoxin system
MIRRLLADADLNGAIVSGVLRRSAHLDFKRAEEVPLEGLSDAAVLAIAAEDDRVLVSHDVTTMPDRFREYVRQRNSPGVILIRQSLSIGRAIDFIVLISEVCDAHDLVNRVCLVPSLVTYGF